jgi:UDP-glucose 4-epimerase
MPPSRFLVVGGAGFIGSHVVERLLARADPERRVVVYDNLCSGSRSRLSALGTDERLSLVEADVAELELLCDAANGAEVCFHFAANPDIAAATLQPDIDFREGTQLMQNVLEALRRASVPRLVYASGSGVYGDVGETEVGEDYGPMLPISTYGASKLGCEALISAYCHMFGLATSAFRFANVVGPRQTHGVTYDFVRRLIADPSVLEVRGDGTQSKSYIHVEDVVDAMMLISGQQAPGFEVFNVGTDEYITVREIAEQVISTLGLRDVRVAYEPQPRGWTGDVPIVRFSSKRIRDRGWSNAHSTEAALQASIEHSVVEAGADS